MKRFLVLIPVILFSSFLLQEDKNIIVWQEDQLLTWDDFKGKPERRFAAASTRYDIWKRVVKKDANSATVTVKAVFFCKDSWKNDRWADKTVLAHEQKHFDIAELFARKLRKLIQQTKFQTYKAVELKTDSLYEIVDKQMDLYHDLYDEETDGSMNGEKQKEWNKKIESEIESLSAYKQTSLTVSCGKK